MKRCDSVSPNLTPATVRDLRKALEAKRDELIRNHFRLEEIAVERESISTDRAAADNERNMAAERLSRNAFLLHEVWDALDRLASGHYGKCLDCGAPIDTKHLAKLPWVAFCNSCRHAVVSLNPDKSSRISRAS